MWNNKAPLSLYFNDKAGRRESSSTPTMPTAAAIIRITTAAARGAQRSLSLPLSINNLKRYYTKAQDYQRESEKDKSAPKRRLERERFGEGNIAPVADKGSCCYTLPSSLLYPHAHLILSTAC